MLRNICSCVIDFCCSNRHHHYRPIWKVIEKLFCSVQNSVICWGERCRRKNLRVERAWGSGLHHGPVFQSIWHWWQRSKHSSRREKIWVKWTDNNTVERSQNHIALVIGLVHVAGTIVYHVLLYEECWKLMQVQKTRLSDQSRSACCLKDPRI